MNKRASILLVGAMLGGCGASAQTAKNASLAAELATQQQALERVLSENAAQRETVRRLESQLALARTKGDDSSCGETDAPQRNRKREPLEPLPTHSERLHVTQGPVPALPIDEASPVDANEQLAVDAYKHALSLVHQRKFAEAQQAFEAFVGNYPDHAYTDNALFWMGEMWYLQRKYRAAQDVFEQLYRQHPAGNKVPDALYKLGMISRKLGDENTARSYFKQVRVRFPNTAAAALAAQEDAS